MTSNDFRNLRRATPRFTAKSIRRWSLVRGFALKGFIYTLLALAAAAGVVNLAISMMQPTEIEVVSPWRGRIRESFTEPARTRLENTWLISTQVAGRVGRIDLEPGDLVTRGQTLAEFDLTPFQTSIEEFEAQIAEFEARLELNADDRMDEKALEEAGARAESAAKSLEAAQARIESAQVRVTYTQSELQRFVKLLADGVANASDFENAQMEADTALKSLTSAEADSAAQQSLLTAQRLAADKIREQIARKKIERKEIEARLDQARARKRDAAHRLDLAVIVSPIDGVVLERHTRGERPMLLGTELLLLGDPGQIEVISDVLTEDALKLTPGARVELDSLSGDLPIEGEVKRIEPRGFTKFSSLGVEQQRVNVIVEITNPPARLQVGYRLYARFFTGQKESALIVPRFTVLQSADRTFHVFTVEEGELVRRPVTIGLRTDLELEILDGLDESSRVVARPDSTMEEGGRYEAVEATGLAAQPAARDANGPKN